MSDIRLSSNDQNNLISITGVQEFDEDSDSSFNMDNYLIFRRPANPPVVYNDILDDLRSSIGENSTVEGSGVSLMKLITYTLT